MEEYDHNERPIEINQIVTEQEIHINKSLKHNPSSLHDITILNISHKNFTFVLILSLSLQNTHETAAGN